MKKKTVEALGVIGGAMQDQVKVAKSEYDELGAAAKKQLVASAVAATVLIVGTHMVRNALNKKTHHIAVKKM